MDASDVQQNNARCALFLACIALTASICEALQNTHQFRRGKLRIAFLTTNFHRGLNNEMICYDALSRLSLGFTQLCGFCVSSSDFICATVFNWFRSSNLFASTHNLDINHKSYAWSAEIFNNPFRRDISKHITRFPYNSPVKDVPRSIPRQEENAPIR
jgi:hypothetical protein